MTAITSFSPLSPESRRPLDRLPLLMFALVCVGELPLLMKFFADLWTRPQYDFYPLILAGAVYLAWDRIRDAPDRPLEESRVMGAGLLVIALLALVLGNLLLIRSLGGISAWIALAGCVCWIGGLPLLRRVAPSFVLLVTIMPPPMRKDEAIALNLRQWAVWASTRVLDLLQIPHVSTGTLINIAGHRLGVEDACSGIHSLLAVIAVTLMLGFFWRRPIWRIIALMACSIIFVVWANIFRIAAGAYLIETWKIDILSGSAHELLGLVLFMLCIALTASLDQFLMLLRSEEPITSVASAQYGRSPAFFAGRLPDWAGWSMAVAFLLLGVVTQFRVASLWPTSSIAATARFSLPPSVGAWQRVDGSEQVIGRPEVLGQHSFIWTYRNGAHTALVACDYPFPGYHELGICYASSGWKIARTGRAGVADQAGRGGASTELDMHRPSPAFATLLYSCCDEQGRWLGPETYESKEGLKLALELSYERAKAPQAYQVQVLLQGFEPISDTDREQLRELFFSVRDNFASQLATLAAGGK
jgi:exosortase